MCRVRKRFFFRSLVDKCLIKYFSYCCHFKKDCWWAYFLSIHMLYQRSFFYFLLSHDIIVHQNEYTHSIHSPHESRKYHTPKIGKTNFLQKKVIPIRTIFTACMFQWANIDGFSPNISCMFVCFFPSLANTFLCSIFVCFLK